MKVNFLIVVVWVVACNPSRQGKVIQGKNGVIESAVIKARCTPPQKSYAKEIEAKVKAEMDSLRYMSPSSFDASYIQKVIKLREYSSQGLDLDLLTFRICEMANNRGLTSEQTSELIKKALELWDRGQKQAQLQQTIISNNQTGGITAGNVYLDKPARDFTNEKRQELLKMISEYSYDTLFVHAASGDLEAEKLANQIHKFLFDTYKNSKVSRTVTPALYFPAMYDVTVDFRTVNNIKTVTIIVGHNKGNQ